MGAETEILMAGEEEVEAAVVVLDEEDVGDRITTPTTTIMRTGMVVKIRNNSTTPINPNSNNHHLRNSKVNPAMILRTSLIKGRE